MKNEIIKTIKKLTLLATVKSHLYDYLVDNAYFILEEDDVYKTKTDLIEELKPHFYSSYSNIEDLLLLEGFVFAKLQKRFPHCKDWEAVRKHIKNNIVYNLNHIKDYNEKTVVNICTKALNEAIEVRIYETENEESLLVPSRQ